MLPDSADRLGSESRGVSNVIGIVMLVGITVLLGAVVGSAALHLGGDVGPTQPNAQLAVEDASELVGESAGANVLEITHEGGDDLETTGLRLVIRQDGDVYYNAILAKDTYERENGYAPLESDASGKFASGQAITVAEQSGEFAPGKYRIQLIHVDSDSLLVDEEVKIN
ncbi:hypothetical protein GCM10009039_00360 [Halocalculus aciditolerans]|uniref:Archaeal Type IV pilin N-terminal domain-containing protein n=1 Tax=Halocalculus aciditolerans TaxID=1383812 RepID=A0A830FEL1_9EURY|nr:hypothetical protein GCM10009039_00360 [Halocalculus aciditolerans]